MKIPLDMTGCGRLREIELRRGAADFDGDDGGPRLRGLDGRLLELPGSGFDLHGGADGLVARVREDGVGAVHFHFVVAGRELDCTDCGLTWPLILPATWARCRSSTIARQ